MCSSGFAYVSSLTEATNVVKKPLHLAIGIFDGVHLGHQSVIESAIHFSHSCCEVAGVLTFFPHPSRLVLEREPTQLIMPLPTKIGLLKQMGVDIVIVQPFTPGFAAIEATQFLPFLKEKLPTLSSIYVGSHFRFGYGRKGAVVDMVAQAQACGLTIYSIQGIKRGTQRISSTLIREKLAVGDMHSVNALLGYAYFSEGEVESGEGRGQQLGFPTLNFPWEPERLPRFGVYAVRLHGEWGTSLGVANYGVRPTVGSNQTKPLLEVHLFEPPPSIQGFFKVEWLSFLRSERKFSSMKALKEQIGKDKKEAMAILRFRSLENSTK